MKKLSILFVLTFVLLNSVYSQEKNTSREIGLHFNNFDSFGIRYKFGNEKRIFRLTGISLNTRSISQNRNITNEPISDNTNFGVRLNFGVEYPIKIADNLNFFYGGELSGAYSHNKIEFTNNNSNKLNVYSAGIGFILGFSHNIKSNILLSAEIIPSFVYTNSENDENNSTEFAFELSNNFAGITLGYKF
jgi:hypothetical protein